MKPIKTMFAPNDALNRCMGACLLAGSATEETKFIKTEYDSITILDGENDIFKWDSFDPFTVIVHDAICSLWEQGKKEITTNQIWRVIAGAEAGDRPSDKILTALHEVIGKLMKTHVEIVVEDSKRQTICKFRGQMIGCKTRTDYQKGCIKIDCIKLYDIPVFLEYAKRRRRIATYPVALLALGSYTTSKTASLKHFLLKEIEVIRNEKNNRNNVILIDRLYREVGCTSRSQRQETREQIKKFLDALQDEKHIKSFSFRQSGNEVEAIIIEVDTENT